MNDNNPWLAQRLVDSVKALTWLKPIVGTFCGSLLLAGCTGTGGESTSSQTSSVVIETSSEPSSVAVSSVPVMLSSESVSSTDSARCDADISIGRDIYHAGGLDCKTCHGAPDGSNKTPGGASISIPIFDSPYGVDKGPEASLSVYIASYMNDYFNSACPTTSADCGKHIAAYLYDTAGRDWCAENPPTSDIPASSKAPQSSSSMAAQSSEAPRLVSVLRINVGGGEVLDGNGKTFLADTGFTGGNAGDLTNSIQEVPNTDDDNLFKSERWNAFSYGFELPNNTYQVELGFVEMVTNHQAGSRVFNVAMEGDVRLSNVDIVASVGASRTAMVRTVENVVVNDGSLDLDFTKVTHNPTVSYIHIKRFEQPKDKYDRMCGYCHGGEKGEFRSELGDALVKSRCSDGVCSTRSGLASYITATMPFGLAEGCSGKCAEDIANYIFDNFAGFGNNPGVNLPDFLDKAGSVDSCGAPDSSYAALKRVTELDYGNMVNDLFGLDESFKNAFAGDEKLGPFSINFQTAATLDQVTSYYAIASEVAEKAVANKAAWVPCSNQNDNCAEQIIRDVARKAFRRSLDNTAIERLMSIFSSARNAGNFDTGLKVALEAILTSPRFLYYWMLLITINFRPISKFALKLIACLMISALVKL